MKRYVIPAFFVVDADTRDAAEEIAGEMQHVANRAIIGNGVKTLILDEEMKDKVMDIPNPDQDELPHTYNDSQLKLVEDVEGKPYLVDVSRTAFAVRTIRVLAKSQQEAELKAIQSACNVDFGIGDHAEYKAETIISEDSKKTR